MRTFTLTALEGTLVLRGDRPRSSDRYEGWAYVAELSTGSVSARVDVYDHIPSRFIEFFLGLAKDWKGWTGERHYESLEPMLKISAKHNGKGHAELTVLLRGGANENFGWSVAQRLTVELGQLAAVAEAASQFAGVEVPVGV